MRSHLATDSYTEVRFPILPIRNIRMEYAGKAGLAANQLVGPKNCWSPSHFLCRATMPALYPDVDMVSIIIRARMVMVTGRRSQQNINTPPPLRTQEKSPSQFSSPRQEKAVSVRFCLSLKGCFVRSQSQLLFVLPDCSAVVAAPSTSYATVGMKVADMGSLSAFGTAFPFSSPLLQVPVHRTLRYLTYLYPFIQLRS
jgi:hypothetical protein